MRKNQIAAQLYSFHDYMKTTGGIAETLAKLKKTGYDAVEVNVSLAQMPAPELNKILTDEGLVACGMGGGRH